MNFWIKTFRRSTSSKNFIPEIDGMRFLAIGTVVIFHFHYLLWRQLDGSVIMNVATDGIDTAGWWLSRMDFGVKLFFAISGFILSIPFFNYYWFKGPKVGLKNYFVRRLTRLEPPFLIAVFGFFLVHLVVLDGSFKELLPHFLATVFYVHTPIFNEYSVINPVTWSLETEVQFYILIPFLAAFALSKQRPKWLALGLGLILFFGSIYLRGVYLSQGTYGMMANISGFFSHFMVGIGFAYVYLTQKTWLEKKSIFWDLVAGISLLGIFLGYKPQAQFLNQVGFNVAMFFLFISAFKSILFNRFLTIPGVYLVGGMCYSIYLIHLPFFGLTSQFVQKFVVGDEYSTNFWIFLFPVLAGLMLISGLFYVLIEKPCMAKDWHIKLLDRLKMKS